MFSKSSTNLGRVPFFSNNSKKISGRLGKSERIECILEMRLESLDIVSIHVNLEKCQADFTSSIDLVLKRN